MMRNGKPMNLDLTTWSAYQLPCQDCGKLVTTRRHPAHPRVLDVRCAACGREHYGLDPRSFIGQKELEERKKTFTPGVPFPRSYERRHTAPTWEPTVTPAPIIVATLLDLDDERIPKTARAMAKKLMAFAKVDITFARGTYQTSSTQRIVESVALRVTKGDARLAVIYIDARFHSALVYSSSGIRKINSIQLREWMNGE